MTNSPHLQNGSASQAGPHASAADWIRRIWRGKVFWAVAIVSMVVLGMLFLSWATRWGPAAYSDSVAYLVSARNLARGVGLGIHTGSGRFQLLTHFPPLYPLSLAILDRLPIPELTAARGLNVVLWGGVLLFPAWVILGTLRRPFLSLLWIGLIAANPFVFRQFNYASSEPLAITLGFSGLFLVWVYSQRPTKVVLVASALAVGLAAVTRYHAIAFVIAGALVTPFALASDTRGRARALALYCLVAAAPIVVWLAYLRLGVAAPSPRLWSAFPDDLWGALQPWRGAMVQTIWEWTGLATYGLLATYRVKALVLISLGILGGAVWLWFLRRPGLGPYDRSSRVGLSVTAAFALAHIGVLAFAWVATSPRPDVDDRILTPLLMASIAFLLITVDSAADLGRFGRPVRATILVGAAAALATWWPATERLAAQLHAEGDGYTSVPWRSSETMEAVLAIPLEVPIISNDASPILFYADHPAYEITELNQRLRLADYPRYGDDHADRAQRAFREEGGRLVLFHSAYWNFEPIYKEDTSVRLAALVEGLDLLGAYGDGDIYRFPSSGAATPRPGLDLLGETMPRGPDDGSTQNPNPAPRGVGGREGRTHAE